MKALEEAVSKRVRNWGMKSSVGHLFNIKDTDDSLVLFVLAQLLAKITLDNFIKNTTAI